MLLRWCTRLLLRCLISPDISPQLMLGTTIRFVSGHFSGWLYAGFVLFLAAGADDSRAVKYPITSGFPFQFDTHDYGAGTLPHGLTPVTAKSRSLDRSKYKTEMCRNILAGRTCKYGKNCQFAHSKKELQEADRHPKYKTELCTIYHTRGFCPYGERCHFIHAEYKGAQESPASEDIEVTLSPSPSPSDPLTLTLTGLMALVLHPLYPEYCTNQS